MKATYLPTKRLKLGLQLKKRVYFCKVKKWIFFIIGLFTSALTNGADGKDTLLRNIMARPDNTEKLFKLINYANQHTISNPIQALSAASNALEISFKLKSKSGEAYSYSSLGTLNYNSSNYAKAIEYFEKAVPIFVDLKDKKGEVYVLKYLGYAYEKQKDYKKALEYYNRYEKNSVSEPAKEKAKVKVGKVRTYEASKMNEKSKKEVKEVESSLNRLPAADKIEIYKELGEIFMNSSDSLSLTFFNKAATIQNTDKTFGYNTNTVIYSKMEALYAAQNNNELAKNFAKIMEEKTLDNLQKRVADTLFYNYATLKLQDWKALATVYENRGDFKEALQAYKQYMLLSDTVKQRQIADSVEKINLISNLQNNEERIRVLELGRDAQEKVIQFQKTLSYFLAFGLVVVFAGLYFLWRISKQKEVSNLKLRFQSLSNRMNPHFIYNSLNSVNLFISRNQEKEANKFLADFSKLMRMVMDNSSRELISLKEEMGVVERYLLLEHNRFGKKFEYTVTVDEEIDLENFWVPPMVIQPYVENAIWHGLRYREDDNGKVTVTIHKENGGVVCAISDNGIGRENSQKLKTKNQLEHKSVGMKNSVERVEILNKIYKKKLEIIITNASEESINPGTLVRLHIPF